MKIPDGKAFCLKYGFFRTIAIDHSSVSVILLNIPILLSSPKRAMLSPSIDTWPSDDTE
jgi:hypothetical protein